VVIRSATLTTCGWLPETTTLRIVGTSAADLVVCQDPINTQPHEVRSLPATKLSLHQQRWLHHWLELARPGYLQDVIAQDTKVDNRQFPLFIDRKYSGYIRNDSYNWIGSYVVGNNYKLQIFGDLRRWLGPILLCRQTSIITMTVVAAGAVIHQFRAKDWIFHCI